ncbi:MAG TPA: cytochrome c-type biogenesis protein CcmH [Gammaproteobacteria bacterium]|nr:cytochrome c-type biogenesis protein CcmH [Gammaproteobacteria bacterium]
MNYLRRCLFLTLLLCLYTQALFAVIEVYEFEEEQQHQQYERLIDELRCPKCQNQNIADSNAPLAKDLRQKVHEQILDGKSHEEIVQYMVDRYGDFVTYRPPLRPVTYLLWFGPFVGVFLVLGILVWRTRRMARVAQQALTQEEEAALAHLLSQNSTKDPIE